MKIWEIGENSQNMEEKFPDFLCFFQIFLRNFQILQVPAGDFTGARKIFEQNLENLENLEKT